METPSIAECGSSKSSVSFPAVGDAQHPHLVGRQAHVVQDTVVTRSESVEIPVASELPDTRREGIIPEMAEAALDAFPDSIEPREIR